MRKWNSEKRAKTQGFSLVELMVVAAIALIIAAVAGPNVIRGKRHLRLRGTATSLVGLLQQARQRAVRDNRNYQVLFDQDAQRTNNLPVLYLDTDYSATYTRGEPMFPLPTDVTTAGASPLNNNQLEGAMSPNANGQEKLVISVSRPTA